MWPLIITNTPDMHTLAVALAGCSERHGIKWQLMITGSVMINLPMLAVFVFGQRYFMGSIKLGTLKGYTHEYGA